MIKLKIAVLLLAATFASATTPVQAGPLKDRAKIAAANARFFGRYVVGAGKYVVRCTLKGKRAQSPGLC